MCALSNVYLINKYGIYSILAKYIHRQKKTCCCLFW